ncbi:MAG: PBP1A family penicillin-binding protein [Deltaproteobacteria bacterium]|nr:MAG: PBP1A family penicillin-binding protein [Deltaproteobacteria bacterium]
MIDFKRIELKKLFQVSLLLIALATVGSAGLILYFSYNLPDIDSLEYYRPNLITKVFSDDEELIEEFYTEKRSIVPFEEIPDVLIKAFVAAEDARFFEHSGLDYRSILRALFRNIEAGGLVQGGSTITQQVTKSLLLSPEKKISRKIREAILSYRIEKYLTKEEILKLYLNQIYLGYGSYGVKAAARNYFGKQVSEINLAEAAMLAGLPRAPNRYSPLNHPQRAKQRQYYVLGRMASKGYISEEEVQEAYNVPLVVLKPREESATRNAQYFVEHIRRHLENRYGFDQLYNGGLFVYTTVDPEVQSTAERALRKGLLELDKRQGYRGPLDNLAPEEIDIFLDKVQKEEVERSAVPEKFILYPEGPTQIVSPEPVDSEKIVPEVGKVYTTIVAKVNSKRAEVMIGRSSGNLPLEEMSWALPPNLKSGYYAKLSDLSMVLSGGDVILTRIKEVKKGGTLLVSLEQEPEVQGALLALDPHTGLVKAMVGGYDFRKSQFNRAFQSRRQPGSAFKPIIYCAALDKGYTPVTTVIDSPIIYDDEEKDDSWKPKNYEERFYGPVTFREALARSKNIVTVKILEDIGVSYLIDYASAMGISSPLTKDLSLALGSSGVSLLELTRAFGVFAAGGYYNPSVFIKRVVDRDGNILEENYPRVEEPERVISEQTSFIMTNLLKNVVEHGTGWRIRALGRPVAGKTGTSNDLHDAWFVGYTSDLVAGVWIGFDHEASLGRYETGSKAASPIWLDFMKEVLRGSPVKDFPIPQGIVFAKIDAETGLLATPESESYVFEAFREGTAPTEYAKEKGSPIIDRFFKDER